MITRKTCLVLGAGASVPYGFPTGPELADEIVRRCATQNDKRQIALREIGFDRGYLREFVDAFASSGQSSIDAFLAHRTAFTGVGKAAIASVLIGFENPGALTNPPQRDDDWFRRLWASLQSGGKAGFPDNQLRVVSFNYDRSFQQLLVDAYRHSFGVMKEEAFEVTSEVVPIVNVHGSLGKLSPVLGPDTRAFTSTLDAGTLRAAAAGIIVLAEGDDSSPEFETARQYVSEAERVILLGCAYHHENMERIGLSTNPHSNRRLGSAYGLTDHERNIIRNRWGIGCGDRNWRSLAFLREEITLD